MPVFDRRPTGCLIPAGCRGTASFGTSSGARRNGQDPVEAVGFVLALHPQTGADERMAAVLKSIFNGSPTGRACNSTSWHAGYPRLPRPLRCCGRRLHTAARRRADHLAWPRSIRLSRASVLMLRHFLAALSVTLPAEGMADRDALESAQTLR